MNKTEYKKTGKVLIDNNSQNKFDIYTDGKYEGIRMDEAWGVTSGAYLIYFTQLKMEMFTIK